MSGVVLYVENRAKLTCRNCYVEIDDGRSVRQVLLEGLDTVVFATAEITISVYLLQQLSALGKMVIFCDSRKFPYGGLVSLYGQQSALRRWREQLGWQRKPHVSETLRRIPFRYI